MRKKNQRLWRWRWRKHACKPSDLRLSWSISNSAFVFILGHQDENLLVERISADARTQFSILMATQRTMMKLIDERRIDRNGDQAKTLVISISRKLKSNKNFSLLFYLLAMRLLSFPFASQHKSNVWMNRRIIFHRHIKSFRFFSFRILKLRKHGNGIENIEHDDWIDRKPILGDGHMTLYVKVCVCAKAAFAAGLIFLLCLTLHWFDEFQINVFICLLLGLTLTKTIFLRRTSSLFRSLFFFFVCLSMWVIQILNEEARPQVIQQWNEK